MLSLFTYIENVYTFEAPVEELARIAAEEISPKAATIAEQLTHRGIKRGVEVGKFNKSVEIAQSMLEEGFDIACIVRVTKLSAGKVEELQEACGTY